MATREIKIEGMTCLQCEMTIAEALTAVGASDVRASWHDAMATLDNGSATDEQLRRAVEAAGYRAVSIQDSPRNRALGTPPVADQTHDYDLIVIGSGSAAFAAAIRATDAGSRVALMESGVVGGTCVNVGCVPSKAMLAPADAYFRAGHHPFAGIQTSANGIDLGAMVDSKAELVDQLRAEKYLDLAGEYGFTICHGLAAFVDTETIACGGERLRGRAYLIATGASPAVPPIEGLKEAGYLTSTTALELREPPRELAVIGANAIGLEMGQLFMRLGSKVTFLEAMPRIAPLEEPEVSETMQAILQEEGATVLTNTRIKSVHRDGKRRTISFEHGGGHRQTSFDDVLVATGRRPNTDGMGLDKAGIELTERGAIKVDEHLRTTNPRV
jgi:mercuric reductase